MSHHTTSSLGVTTIRPAALVLCVCVAGVIGCSGFSTLPADAGADVALDAPAPDAGPELGPDLGLDLGADLEPDLGGAPLDFPCGKDYWANATKQDQNCKPRRVVLIDEGIPQGQPWEQLWTVFGFGLAQSGGKLGVAFDNRVGPEEGHLRLLSFAPGTTQKPPLTSVQIVAGTQFEHLGLAVDIIAAKTGGYHVAYAEIGPQGGQLGVVHWGGLSKPGPFEPISTEVEKKSRVQLVEAVDGKLHALAYEDKAQRLLWRQRAPGGAWSSPQHIVTQIVSTAVGSGQLAARRHAGGYPAFVIHYGSGSASQPRFNRWDPTSGWSSKKTLDNGAFSGLAGYSVGLAIGPTQNHAAYFSAGFTDTKAELWVASWTGVGAVDHVRVSEQIPHDAKFPEYNLAMDVDQWGLLHIVAAVPGDKVGSQAPSGYIEYWRQQRVAGKKTWIMDIVDSDVISDSLSRTHVAIVVEPAGRPHIVYYDGKHARLMYATRDDR
jgi:hypothetical protein